MTEVSDFLVATTALGAVLFCLTYAVVAPFYKSEHGWNFMAFMAVVAVMVAQVIYYRAVDHRGPEWLSIVDWSLTSICIWWRITILIRAQFKRPPSE